MDPGPPGRISLSSTSAYVAHTGGCHSTTDLSSGVSSRTGGHGGGSRGSARLFPMGLRESTHGGCSAGAGCRGLPVRGRKPLSLAARMVDLPHTQRIICGIAVGYADLMHPSTNFTPNRALSPTQSPSTTEPSPNLVGRPRGHPAGMPYELNAILGTFRPAQEPDIRDSAPGCRPAPTARGTGACHQSSPRGDDRSVSQPGWRQAWGQGSV